MPGRPSRPESSGGEDAAEPCRVVQDPAGPAHHRRQGVIVAADGKPTATLADLAAALEDAGVGKDVTLKVLRGSQEREVKVRVIDLAG